MNQCLKIRNDALMYIIFPHYSIAYTYHFFLWQIMLHSQTYVGNVQMCRDLDCHPYILYIASDNIAGIPGWQG